MRSHIDVEREGLDQILHSNSKGVNSKPALLSYRVLVPSSSSSSGRYPVSGSSHQTDLFTASFYKLAAAAATETQVSAAAAMATAATELAKAVPAEKRYAARLCRIPFIQHTLRPSIPCGLCACHTK